MYRWIDFLLLLLAVGLMAFGDLRNLVTPLGYWLAWGGWACAVMLQLCLAQGEIGWRPPRILLVAFLLLAGAPLLTSLVLGDMSSLYQGSKLLVVAGFFCLMYGLIQRLSPVQVVLAVQLTLVSMLLVFICAKLFGDPVWVRLGDGREGSVVAYPGVMWKMAVLFMPLQLADGFARRAGERSTAVCLGICLYLLAVDGSRTGVLLTFATTLVALALFFLRRRRGLSVPSMRFLVMLLCTIPVLLGTHHAIDRWHNGGAFFHVDADAERAVDAERTVDAERAVKNDDHALTAALAPLSLGVKRLEDPDVGRMALLRQGWHQAVNCQPFGCGFGSTISVAHGVEMPVHNAYMAALADFGLLGLASLLGLLCLSAWPLWRARAVLYQNCYLLGAAGGALAFCGAQFLHTFSSEMSEWGYFILLLALAWSPMCCERVPA